MIEGLQPQIEARRHLIGTSSFWKKGPEGVDVPGFDYAHDFIQPYINGLENILIIPHASSALNETPQATADVYKSWGAKTVHSLHEYPGDEERMIEQAPLIHVGGGNYYTLVLNLHALRKPDGSLMDPHSEAVQTPIVEALRKKVADGSPLVGVSAGLLAMPKDGRYADDPILSNHYQSDGTVRTDGLNLLPDHIRFMPHLDDPNIEGIMQRIVNEDPSKLVLGVRDNSIVLIRGTNMQVEGTAETVLVKSGEETIVFQPGTNISSLLNPQTA